MTDSLTSGGSRQGADEDALVALIVEMSVEHAERATVMLTAENKLLRERVAELEARLMPERGEKEARK